MLKALEKSKNIILTVLTFFSKCEYIFSKLYKTASSVLLFSCKQTVMDQGNLLLTFPVYRGTRVHILSSQQDMIRAKIIHGRYDRSFRYRHNACSFPSSWDSICGETCIKYNAKNVSNLFSTCLKYSWCSYLGQWLCWDSHAETRAEPRPRLY